MLNIKAVNDTRTIDDVLGNLYNGTKEYNDFLEILVLSLPKETQDIIIKKMFPIWEDKLTHKFCYDLLINKNFEDVEQSTDIIEHHGENPVKVLKLKLRAKCNLCNEWIDIEEGDYFCNLENHFKYNLCSKEYKIREESLDLTEYKIKIENIRKNNG